MIELFGTLCFLLLIAVVLFAIALRRAEKRIDALEDYNQMQKQFYKIDRKGNMHVLGQLTLYVGDRKLYNDVI